MGLSRFGALCLHKPRSDDPSIRVRIHMCNGTVRDSNPHALGGPGWTQPGLKASCEWNFWGFWLFGPYHQRYNSLDNDRGMLVASEPFLNCMHVNILSDTIIPRYITRKNTDFLVICKQCVYTRLLGMSLFGTMPVMSSYPHTLWVFSPPFMHVLACRGWSKREGSALWEVW